MHPKKRTKKGQILYIEANKFEIIPKIIFSNYCKRELSSHMGLSEAQEHGVL